MQFVIIDHLAIAFSNEKANLSTCMSKLNYEYDGNLLESLQLPMAGVATSFHEIIFIIFQIIIQCSAILVDSYEKEVRTIHALSFSLSYQERYN
jgi:hypothetical protein